MTARVAVAVLLAGLSCPALLPGQGREPLRQPDSVPTGLAAALAASGAFVNQGEPQILVGELPGWFASQVRVPDGARVLGSAFIGSTIVGILSVPAGRDTALDVVEAAMRAAGWADPPPMSRSSGGFQMPQQGTVRQGTWRNLCRNGQTLTILPTRSQTFETTVALRGAAPRGSSWCNPREPDVRTYSYQRRFPTLYNPGFDATSIRECFEQRGGGGGTGTTIRSEMSAALLLEHYGRQLQDSSWVPIGPVRQSAARSWRRIVGTDTALVTVTATPMQTAGCFEMQMNVNSREP